MPQLTLQPWFTAFSCSWCTFLFMSPSKVLTQRFSFLPSLDKTMKLVKTNWGWLWR